jgi:hypothetical protein
MSCTNCSHSFFISLKSYLNGILATHCCNLQNMALFFVVWFAWHSATSVLDVRFERTTSRCGRSYYWGLDWTCPRANQLRRTARMLYIHLVISASVRQDYVQRPMVRWFWRMRKEVAVAYMPAFPTWTERNQNETLSGPNPLPMRNTNATHRSGRKGDIQTNRMDGCVARTAPWWSVSELQWGTRGPRAAGCCTSRSGIVNDGLSVPKNYLRRYMMWEQISAENVASWRWKGNIQK